MISVRVALQNLKQNLSLQAGVLELPLALVAYQTALASG